MTVMKILPQQQSTLEDLASAARIWRDLTVHRGQASFFYSPCCTWPMAPWTPLTNVSINMDGHIITMMECMCRGLRGITAAWGIGPFSNHKDERWRSCGRGQRAIMKEGLMREAVSVIHGCIGNDLTSGRPAAHSNLCWWDGEICVRRCVCGRVT